MTDNALQKPTQNELKQVIERNEVETMAELLWRGANVNEMINDGAGYTLLMKAVFHGHIEMVEFLIHRGADVNARNSRYFTPLMSAISQDHLEIARLLIDKGADVVGTEAYARSYGQRRMKRLFRTRKQEMQEQEALDRLQRCHDTAVERQDRLKSLKPKLRGPQP